MPKKMKKAPHRVLHKDFRAQMLVLIGFIGAGLTNEVINILHDAAERLGDRFYWIYAIFIVFIAWPIFFIVIMKALEEVYLGRK